MKHVEEAAIGHTCCWDAPGRLTSQKRPGTLERERDGQTNDRKSQKKKSH